MFVKPIDNDLENLKDEIKKAFLETVKARAVERVIYDNKDRLEKYYAEVSNKMATEVMKEFPL